MAIETTAFSMIGTGRATNVLSDPMIGWIFPGKNTCPGGTANLTTGIATGEFHAAYCNLVDIGRFVKSGAFIAQIFCPKIIHQNEKNIRFIRECKAIADYA